MTGSGRRCRAMGSRLAAKRSSPPLGAGRGPVNEGRGSYPWCCCGLGLGEVCGGRDPSCWAMSVPPCYTPQETAPAFPPPSSSFSPPSAPRTWPVNLWVRLAGVPAQTFSGENGCHLTISVGLPRETRHYGVLFIYLPCLILPIPILLACFHGVFTFITQGISYPNNSLPLMLSIISHPLPQVNVALSVECQ